MSNPNLTKALADAITRQEGFFPGSAAYKNNNPGNIMDLEYYKKTGGQFRLQTYATLEEGRAALEKLVDRYISAGHTLTSFFAKYAPSGHGDNNPNIYAKNVAGWLGLPLDVPLNQIDLAPSPTSPNGAEVLASTAPTGGGGIEESFDGTTTESGMSTLPLLLITGAVGAALWWWMGD